jgi:hypothetical protein
MALITSPNLESADASYAALIAAHEGLTEAESHAFNARLILILLNQIGSAAVIDQALALARRPARTGDPSVR